VTLAERDAPFTTRVAPESSAYPIAEMAWFEQGLALACSENVLETVAPLTGVTIVTLAKPGAAHSSTEASRRKDFMNKA
jgi:hypothetical protein